MKEPLIIIAGPTASGKSALAVQLALKIGGAVVSADSMQIYKGMDIGTAKITSEEMQGVRHELIDIIDPRETWNVNLFQERARGAVGDILRSGQIPIIAGGTGFYIQALRYGIHFTEGATDDAYRNAAQDYARTHGAEALHKKLIRIDPDSARAIPANNIKRTIRALEYYHTTGETFSSYNRREQQRPPVYNDICFVLDDERSRLYDRIDARVDQMMEDGLLDEVMRLKEEGCTKDMLSMQGIGYKQLLAYLDGQYTLEEAVRLIKRDSRHYAKRQLTWFRRERDVTWLKRDDYGSQEEMLDAMIEECRRRRIIIRRVRT